MVDTYYYNVSSKEVSVDFEPGLPSEDQRRWVLLEDYQKLEAEVEQLRQQLKAPADGGWIEWAGGRAVPC